MSRKTWGRPLWRLIFIELDATGGAQVGTVVEQVIE